MSMQPTVPALEVLDNLIGYALLDSGRRHRQVPPGGLVTRLSAEKRAVLEKLKSDDIKNIRQDLIFDDPDMTSRRQLRDWKLEFDRKTLRL